MTVKDIADGRFDRVLGPGSVRTWARRTTNGLKSVLRPINGLKSVLRADNGLKSVLLVLCITGLKSGLLAADAPILFVVRHQYRSDHHNTATMFQTGEINTGSFQGGGALKTIDLKGRGQITTLLELPDGDRFEWGADSEYIRRPPFLDAMTVQ